MDSVRRHQLQAAYRATRYTVRRGGLELALVIGGRSAELDRWLDEVGCREWAYLTACNPGSQVLSDQENARRQAELVAQLQRRGHVVWHGAGEPLAAGWRAEASVLVPGMGRREAVDWARGFGPCAVVVGVRGGVGELAWA
ncbi:MAG: DUF3293 domain-containing protein [Planctomycetia bacterium]